MILLNNTVHNEQDFSEKLFGEGLSVYEVIRIHSGKPIFLSDNLLRLSNSLKKSNIGTDISNLEIPAKIKRYIALEHITEGNLKYVLHFTKDKMDEYLYQIPHSYPSAKDYENGVLTITYPVMRENPEVKYINNDLRILANRLIQEHHVYEILLVDKEGFITEGSRSNIFFIKKNTLFTASTEYVLPGTSRKRVFDICKEEGVQIIEQRAACCNLFEYEAAFITGTSPLILPIRKIDNFVFDTNNDLLIRLMNVYFSLLEGRNS